MEQSGAGVRENWDIFLKKDRNSSRGVSNQPCDTHNAPGRSRFHQQTRTIWAQPYVVDGVGLFLLEFAFKDWLN